MCDFCKSNLEVNKAAFDDPRLELIIDDAKAQLEVGACRRLASVHSMGCRTGAEC